MGTPSQSCGTSLALALQIMIMSSVTVLFDYTLYGASELWMMGSIANPDDNM